MLMKSIFLSLIAAGTLTAMSVRTLHSYIQSADPSESNSIMSVPLGYRDWKMISVAHEEGNLNDIRAILGNDIALEAYRKNVRPFPEGTIIARLAWSYVSSDENNMAFGRRQSFIAGSPTNVQFIVKDSKRYASTGGWGFAQFEDGKPNNEAVSTACFSCHQKAAGRDSVFTYYAP